MLGYIAAATALKMFSATPQTKKFYRFLGNKVGARKRATSQLPKPYVDRAKQIISKTKSLNAVKAGDKLLEIGTGYFHWESTILRCLYDVEVTVFDVWDNRQFPAFREYFRQLDLKVDQELPLDAEEKNKIHAYIAKIQQSTSFDEAYRFLGHKYVLNPSGTLDHFPENHFDYIFSASVFEHVEKGIIPAFMKGQYRILKPGGLCYHLIDLGDHLTLYDKSMPYNKNYLRYSNATWRVFFQNDVQYFNRVQRPEWQQHFRDAGFVLVDDRAETINVDDLRVSQDFKKFRPEDLACLTMYVVYQKPK